VEYTLLHHSRQVTSPVRTQSRLYSSHCPRKRAGAPP